MMRGEGCILWHSHHTKEGCTSQGAQARKVPFQRFRVSIHYLMGCPVLQGNGINLIVYSVEDSTSFSSSSSSSSADVSNKPNEEDEDESEMVWRLVGRRCRLRRH